MDTTQKQATSCHVYDHTMKLAECGSFPYVHQDISLLIDHMLILVHTWTQSWLNKSVLPNQQLLYQTKSSSYGPLSFDKMGLTRDEKKITLPHHSSISSFICPPLFSVGGGWPTLVANQFELSRMAGATILTTPQGSGAIFQTSNYKEAQCRLDMTLTDFYRVLLVSHW